MSTYVPYLVQTHKQVFVIRNSAWEGVDKYSMLCGSVVEKLGNEWGSTIAVVLGRKF